MKHIGKFFLLILCLLLGIFLYSKYIGIKGVCVKEYKIVNKNIPKNFDNLKIIHFSDIHYGITIHKIELAEIVEKINETNPDLVVFTGDLFDKNYKIREKDVENITSLFQKIDANLGKYAIKGENDEDHEKFETIITNSDFINLNDTFDYIYKDDYTPILLTGLSSNLTNKKDINEKLLLSQMEISNYNKNNKDPIYSILLMHEPDFIDKIDTNFYHLALAGHSHNGQIGIPILENFFLEEGSLKYYKRHYTIKNTNLYISGGLGTHKYPYRLLKPSIHLYRLKIN